jgi:TPR repeat protein
MNMPCTKYSRTTAMPPRSGASYPPGGGYDVRRSRRRGGGHWPGAAAAAALLGIFLLHGGRSPSDAQELAWLNRLAATDDPGAQLQLGLAYRDGRYGLAPDAGAGRYWLQRAARNGQDYAAGLLAGRATDGNAGAVSPTPASSRLEALARQLKSPILATVSGLWKMLTLGMNGDQSSDVLQQRAQSGDPVAEYQLAMRYRDGAWSVNRDPARAFYWLQRAAGAGDGPAMQTLAEVYRTGALGATRDLDKAEQWQRRVTALSGPQG